MIIPVGFQHVAHFFGGAACPNGAAITYGTITSGSHTPGSAALDLHDLFDDTILNVLVDGVQLVSTRVKYGPNATGPFAVAGGPVAGGLANDGTPPNVSYLVRKNTGTGGKSGHGRMYIPGVRESGVGEGGALEGGSSTALQMQVDAFLEGVETLFGNMVLFHNASSDPTTVTSLVVDGHVATQRRRLR